MVTPRRELPYHFTHISNLALIAKEGLYSDTKIKASHTSPREVGHASTKQRRRGLPVPPDPGGHVADYVPSFFAARSPMLFVISKGNVPTYSGTQDEIVYLVTSIGKVVNQGLPFVFTDRNAALDYAEYENNLKNLNDYVDWTLMEARYWNATDEEPDRKERRMAEFLVHGHVPAQVILGVATRTNDVSKKAQRALAKVGSSIPVTTQPDWYFDG